MQLAKWSERMMVRSSKVGIAAGVLGMALVGSAALVWAADAPNDVRGKSELQSAK
jgi:hypothetical protein